MKSCSVGVSPVHTVSGSGSPAATTTPGRRPRERHPGAQDVLDADVLPESGERRLRAPGCEDEQDFALARLHGRSS